MKNEKYIKFFTDLIKFIDFIGDLQNKKLKTYLSKDFPELSLNYQALLDDLFYIQFVLKQIHSLIKKDEINKSLLNEIKQINYEDYNELINILNYIFFKTYMNNVINPDKKERLQESITVLIILLQRYETWN